MSRVSELEAWIRERSHEYYNGIATVSDDVFEIRKLELVALTSGDSEALKAIGSPPVSDWEKVLHSIPMGSLDKVQTPEDFRLWAEKIGRAPTELFTVTDKIDGISISLQYKDGALIQAVTRGDGTTGEDITENVRKMKGVPLTLAEPESVHVRGEIVLFKQDFLDHFSGYSNPRNTASGTAKKRDGKSEHLTVLAYKVLEGPDVKTEADQLQLLRRLGFKLPTCHGPLDTKQVVELWEEYQATTRDALPYEIDGLVVCLDDLTHQLSLGESSGRPNGSTAFKFRPLHKETVIREIIWQVGSTGRITPVAVFDEIDLLGAKVTRASLYNLAYIEELKIDVGSKVFVARANDVIPRVVAVLESTGTALAPKTCPCCETPTARDGEYIVCSNLEECPAHVTGRLKQWVKELNILEWGDALIQKLADEGYVKTVADLYRLSKEDLASLDRFGEKSAENALRTLCAANPMSLENFLGALSIPLCATSTIRVIVDAGYSTLNDIQEASIEELEAIAGVGPKRAAALHHWTQRNLDLLIDLMGVGIEIKDRATGSLTGKSVCFTGKSTLKRGELELLATKAGGIVKNSVGKGLTYLVLADPNSTSTKAQAAKKNGTLCISEEDFVAMCGG